MARLLLLIMMMSLSVCYGQTLTDSLKIKMRQSESIYQKRTDSLQRELQFYKIKEDYFVSALDRQGSHFEFLLSSLIGFIAILIALGSFVSFKFFENKINSVKTELNKDILTQATDIQRVKEQVNDVKAEFYYQLGIIINRQYGSVSNDMLNESRLSGFLNSINNLIEAYIHSDGETKNVFKRDLLTVSRNGVRAANELIKELSSSETDRLEERKLKTLGVLSILKIKFAKQILKIDDTDINLKNIELLALIEKLENISKK